MQLVLVLETRFSCQSDYRYIKSAIDYFYVERTCKLTPIYAKNKSELINQDKKINECKNKYNGDTKVVLCADYDRESDCDNDAIISYCLINNYDLVWMNLDIEDVFLGKQVPNKAKNKESINFLTKKNKILSGLKTISEVNPLLKRHTSNLLVVLDKYLIRKT